MINKYVRKSLACKKGDEILIWSWNESEVILTGHYINMDGSGMVLEIGEQWAVDKMKCNLMVQTKNSSVS